MSIQIRNADPSDLESIRQIYNHEVLSGVNAFDLVKRSMEQQQEWFLKHTEKYPVLVAEQNHEIIGWGSLSPWAPHGGYYATVEHSVFVKPGFQGQGVGKKLVQSLLHEASRLEYHTIIARITGGNDASVAMHKKLGFLDCGMMKEVGYKFGKRLDVFIMQYFVKNA